MPLGTRQLPCPPHSPAPMALAPCPSKKRVRATSRISSFFHFSCVAPTHLTEMPAGLAGTQRCLFTLPEEAASGSGWALQMAEPAPQGCLCAVRPHPGSDFLILCPGIYSFSSNISTHPCVSFLVRTEEILQSQWLKFHSRAMSDWGRVKHLEVSGRNAEGCSGCPCSSSSPQPGKTKP